MMKILVIDKIEKDREKLNNILNIARRRMYWANIQMFASLSCVIGGIIIWMYVLNHIYNWGLPLP